MSHDAEMIRLAEEYGAHNYHPLDVVIAKGEGVWVWDGEGRKEHRQCSGQQWKDAGFASAN